MTAHGALLAVCGLMLLPAARAADLTGEELLSNRGFEAVGPLGTVVYAYKGWTVANDLVPGGWAGLPATAEAAIEMVRGADAHSGSMCMRIRSGTQNPEVFSEPFYPAGPGFCFRMSVWARGSGRGSLFAYEYGDKGMGGGYVTTFDLTPEWAQHAGVCFPAEACRQIRFVLRTFPGSTADYDDVGMVRLSERTVTPELAGELLNNGGLEHESPVRDDWLQRLGLPAGATRPDFFELNGEKAVLTMVHDRAQAHGGEVCARFERTAEGGWLHLYTPYGCRALPGVGFVLKAWLRGTGSAWLGLYDAAADGTPAEATVTVDDQWREYRVVLTPALSAKSVRFAVGTTDKVLWVDDLSLTFAPRAAGSGADVGRDPDME
ncbi:MAG: hypothetical protein HYU66_09545 [Armatimonadetes bacterium]|nr:hypothetical protein [Armatimonadota bacterium]